MSALTLSLNAKKFMCFMKKMTEPSIEHKKKLTCFLSASESAGALLVVGYQKKTCIQGCGHNQKVGAQFIV